MTRPHHRTSRDRTGPELQSVPGSVPANTRGGFVAQAQQTVLLICADRESAGRLAAVIQSAERHIVAAPWGDVARARASGAQLIVVDRVEDDGTNTGFGHSAQKVVVTHVRETPEFASVPILC